MNFLCSLITLLQTWKKGKGGAWFRRGAFLNFFGLMEGEWLSVEALILGLMVCTCNAYIKM